RGKVFHDRDEVREGELLFLADTFPFASLRVTARITSPSCIPWVKLKPVRPSDELRLADADATARKAPDSDTLKSESEKYKKRIGELQELLYADRRRALLIVLQGRDAAGKDGTI